VQEKLVEKADNIIEGIKNDGATDSEIKSLKNENVEELNVNAKESPYDNKSEIKVVKRMQPLNTDDEDQITFIGPVYD
ncbi:hypothetical protein Tco_0555216, partial [Tanacetum coccineum]